MNATEKTIKPQSFRVDSELANRFRALCEENNLNQSEGFEQILTAFELSRAGTLLPSRETEINNFRNHLNELQSAYLFSLELYENTESRVKDEFRRELETQSKVISEYQEQNEVLKQQLVQEQQKSQQYDSLLAQLDGLKKALSEKEDFIAMLQKQSAKLDQFDELQEEILSLKTQLLKLNEEKAELCQKHADDVLKFLSK